MIKPVVFLLAFVLFIPLALSNSCDSALTSCKLAELEITNLEANYIDKHGEFYIVYVTADVLNSGNLDAPLSHSSFVIKELDNGERSGVLREVPIGQTRQTFGTYIILESGTYNAEVYIDVKEEVREYNERNNFGSFEFTLR